MATLSRRLQSVADLVPYGVHADIGSDHGYLLRALLLTNRISKGIAIENKPDPYANSLRTLETLQAEVRLADGFQGLSPGEVDSVSLSGMGGELIVKILSAHAQRVPGVVITQPNRRPEVVRKWALENHYHLTHEKFVVDNHGFVTMMFCHKPDKLDPVYASVDRPSALLFGPILLRNRPADYLQTLRDEHRYLGELARRDESSQYRYDLLTKTLQRFD